MIDADYADDSDLDADARAQALALRHERDFLEIARRPEGRRFIRRIVDQCGIMVNTFSDNRSLNDYHAGRRSIGLWLLNEFDADAELYLQFLRDAKHDD